MAKGSGDLCLGSGPEWPLSAWMILSELLQFSWSIPPTPSLLSVSANKSYEEDLLLG